MKNTMFECTSWEACILTFCLKKHPTSCELGTAVWIHAFHFWTSSSCSLWGFFFLNHAPGTAIQREQSAPKAYLIADTEPFLEFFNCRKSMWNELASPYPPQNHLKISNKNSDTPKVMHPIYFQGNYNRYKGHNNIIW